MDIFLFSSDLLCQCGTRMDHMCLLLEPHRRDSEESNSSFSKECCSGSSRWPIQTSFPQPITLFDFLLVKSFPMLPIVLLLVVLFHSQHLRAYKVSQILAEGKKENFKTLTMDPGRNHLLRLAYCSSNAMVSQETWTIDSLQKL